jgi:hypothetical protein
MAMVHPFM